MTYDASWMALFVLCELAVFLSFLIASQMMIRSSGGITDLGKIQFPDQLRFAWSIIWRMLVLFLVVALASYAAGIEPYLSVVAFLAFDGIVFPWPVTLLPVWSALAATLVFLAVVDRGMGRMPTARVVVGQFVQRLRHLGPAIIYLAAAIFIIQAVQMGVADIIRPMLRSMSSRTLSNFLSVGFLLSFSYLRLYVTVVILTLAVKASYRRSSASPTGD